MQNSELFRRGVVLPLNEEAEESLRISGVEEQTRVRYLEIESEEEFAILWNIGIFQKINEQVDGLIDDYEEYFFDAGKMPKVLVAINEVKSAGELSDSVESFMTSLSSMVLEASSIQKPLLFVF